MARCKCEHYKSLRVFWARASTCGDLDCDAHSGNMRLYQQQCLDCKKVSLVDMNNTQYSGSAIRELKAPTIGGLGK